MPQLSVTLIQLLSIKRMYFQIVKYSMFMLQASERTARAIKRATVFLEGESDKLIDTYEMAIVAYALKLVGSAKAIIILERLETLAANEGMVFFINCI